jgi:hypothetical protein
MKMKQFRSILAVAVVATSITTSLLPAQAIPLDEVLDSAGKSFVRGLFGLPAERQQAPQSAGFNDRSPQPPMAPANPVSQQNNNPYQSSSPQPSSPRQQPNSQVLRANCISANGNNPENIDRDSPESSISVGRRLVRVFRKALILSDNSSSYERTCRILSHPASEKLSVAFAIPDNSNLTRARVSIYVGGQEKARGMIFAGQARKYTVDLSGAHSYAIVVKPLDGGDYIYPLPVAQPR